MREGQAAKHAFSRRAAVRITRGGPDHILVGHSSSRGRRVDPSGRGDETRGEPSFAIILGDPDRAPRQRLMPSPVAYLLIP
jgi:hypothetical protein